ncbi:UDP-glucose 4-epimerase family protein [Metapseudomonas otitidis]|uniref:UDP-glucose 4-epimerase n=1 Tax=Metapseudomonas otitidis TaxID=319939 RepID=A0A679GV44_9GAMM|nr:SDR family oxidoreductase [Pseudomonas otitidis]BCA29874.1 UDP-glucose 4-epimerase [Pseudomonas otitidis]
MRILVTGASGFIGNFLCRELVTRGYSVLAMARSHFELDGVETVRASLSEVELLSEVLREVECIVHLAGLAHQTASSNVDPLPEFRAINCDATLKLARQASAAGVKRFIFISSIGVNGNINTRPFKSSDEPAPIGPYAQSKWEAEQGLRTIQQELGIDCVVIRPPLVYGPGAPGNFGSLLRWVDRGLPLPLGAVHNKRSLISVYNLTDLIARCIDHPAAANQLFLAGDGEDLSTTALLRGVAEAMDRPSRLIPVPAVLLGVAARLFGKGAIAQRLLGSLQVDISKTREVLSWNPPVSVKDGLRRCIRDPSV